MNGFLKNPKQMKNYIIAYKGKGFVAQKISTGIKVSKLKITLEREKCFDHNWIIQLPNNPDHTSLTHNYQHL